MNGKGTLIRQVHRWISIIFVISVVAVMLSANGESTPEWAYYLPLLPLILLALTGLYLFFLPYLNKRAERS